MISSSTEKPPRVLSSSSRTIDSPATASVTETDSTEDGDNNNNREKRPDRTMSITGGGKPPLPCLPTEVDSSKPSSVNSDDPYPTDEDLDDDLDGMPDVDDDDDDDDTSNNINNHGLSPLPFERGIEVEWMDISDDLLQLPIAPCAPSDEQPPPEDDPPDSSPLRPAALPATTTSS